MFDQKPTGMLAGRVSALPAGGAAADCPFEAGHGARDRVAFFCLGQQKMPDEALAVATQVKIVLSDRFRYLWIARERLGAGINGDWYPAFIHQVDDAPEAYP